MPGDDPTAVAADAQAAVVTGAASGIGRATALALARRGLAVAAVDRDGEGLRRTAEEGTSGGATIEGFGVDVADAGAVGALARAVGDRFGAPRVVINCAGWDETRAFVETDRRFWERVVAINLMGVIAVTHAFLAAMIERGRGGQIGRAHV